jgi:rhodanese-related sulfurtransferase
MEQYRERMAKINPLNSLGPQQMDELCKNSEFLELKKDHVLFKLGDHDAYAYYLMEGEMEISGDSDRVRKIDSESDNGNYAIGNLQPRPFTAKITSKTAIVQKTSRDMVEQLVARRQMVTGEMPAVTVSDMAEPEGVDGAWMFQMIQSEIFRDLPTENIERFFSAVERIEYKEGDVVVTQGEKGDYYYMIAEGKCLVSRKVVMISFDIAELEPGNSFGEEALISGGKRNATVSMKTDGVLMRLSQENFAELLKHPTIKSISANDAAHQVQDGKATLLDVRMESEHGAKSIHDSLNIPLYKLRERLKELDKSTNYVTYCDTGARSSSAAFLLCQRGYEATYLEGGLSSLMPGGEE